MDAFGHLFVLISIILGLTITQLMQGFLASLTKDVVLSGHLPSGVNLVFHLALIAASVAAMSIRSERYHAANVVAVGAAVGAYVVLLFTRLQ